MLDSNIENPAGSLCWYYLQFCAKSKTSDYWNLNYPGKLKCPMG